MRVRATVGSACLCLVSACASTDKPTKQMIFASAALKAAERASAEKRSPDMYRRAENTYWKATQLYIGKEYEQSGIMAIKAMRLAEASEMDAEIKDSTSNNEGGG